MCAQNQPDLSGVWEISKEKSHLSSERPMPSMRIKLDQKGPDVTLTSRSYTGGKLTQQNTYRYTVGAESRNQMHGGPMTSRTEWADGTLVVRSSVALDKELRLTDRFTLSPDGRELTWREWHQYGADTEGEEAYLFNRQAEGSWEPDAPPKMAEEVYKNVQMLKGVPADRVMMAMNFFAQSLGVKCGFCHVDGAFDKDDKPAKVTARAMWTMANKINADNFKGSHPITCWTCHRGQSKPQSAPQ